MTASWRATATRAFLEADSLGRHAARLRRDGITARLSCSFSFLTIRGEGGRRCQGQRAGEGIACRYQTGVVCRIGACIAASMPIRRPKRSRRARGIYPIDSLGSDLDDSELSCVMSVHLIESTLLELFATLLGVAPNADERC